LDTKATGDTAICQKQLKKTRIQQPTEDGQTGKVEHETVMASDEGNKLVDSLNQHHIHSNIISEGIFDNVFVLFAFIKNVIHSNISPDFIIHLLNIL
jgi:hypothetical protein